jgi:hypothetical protein
VVGDVDMDEFSTVVSKDQESEEQVEGEGRDDEEVDGDNLADMYPEEGTPCRGWPSRCTRRPSFVPAISITPIRATAPRVAGFQTTAIVLAGPSACSNSTHFPAMPSSKAFETPVMFLPGLPSEVTSPAPERREARCAGGRWALPTGRIHRGRARPRPDSESPAGRTIWVTDRKALQRTGNSVDHGSDSDGGRRLRRLAASDLIRARRPKQFWPTSPHRPGRERPPKQTETVTAGTRAAAVHAAGSPA